MKKMYKFYMWFVYVDSGYGVALRDRQKGGRGWLRALDALSLVVKKWRAFVFPQFVCIVNIAPLVNFN